MEKKKNSKIKNIEIYQKRPQIAFSNNESSNNNNSFNQNIEANRFSANRSNDFKPIYSQINTNINSSKINNNQNNIQNNESNKINKDNNNNIKSTFNLPSTQRQFVKQNLDYNKIIYHLEPHTDKIAIDPKKLFNTNQTLRKKIINNFPQPKNLTFNSNNNIMEHEILSPEKANPYVDRAFKISGNWDFQKIKNIIPENKLKKLEKIMPMNQKSVTINSLNNNKNEIKIIDKNKNEVQKESSKMKIIKLSKNEIYSINNSSGNISSNINLQNNIQNNIQNNMDAVQNNIQNNVQKNIQTNIQNNNSNKNTQKNNIIFNNRINTKPKNNEIVRNEAAKKIQNNYHIYINRKNFLLLKQKLLSESNEYINKIYQECTSNWKINLNEIENDTQFSPKNWKTFYPPDERFFLFNYGFTFQNCIKIEKNPILSIYEGETNFLNQKHGFGKLTTPNNIYLGGWRFDKFTGWGREYKYDGSILEGKFMGGLLCGKGILKNLKGDIYVGEFMDSNRNGKGDLKTKKIHYIGEFANNKLNGKGKLDFLLDGHEYKGQFIDNEISGIGVFKWKNGDVYEGEMKAGKMQGKGKYKFKSGQIIEGNFVNGKFQGKI